MSPVETKQETELQFRSKILEQPTQAMRLQKVIPKGITQIQKKNVGPSKLGRTSVSTFKLRSLYSEKYALRRVLFVEIEKTDDGESFIAKIPFLETFGLGVTKEEAIYDFEQSLIEDYEVLTEEKDRLGYHLSSHFENLKKIIRQIPCH